MKMSSIAAWENSKKANLEAELKKIEVTNIIYLQLHILLLTKFSILGTSYHPYIFCVCCAGKIREKESGIYREDEEQGRATPQGCGREASND